MTRTAIHTIPATLIILAVLFCTAHLAQAQLDDAIPPVEVDTSVRTNASTVAERINTIRAQQQERIDAVHSAVNSAVASSTRTMEMSDEKRAEFQARAEALRANASIRADIQAERSAERLANVSAQIEQRIRTVMANMQDRIANSSAKLTSIADRIEERADTLSERGVDVAPALSFIAEARVELRNASIIINEDLAVEMAAALESEDPRAAFEFVKESIREAGGHIKTAHQLLREAVASLKEAAHALQPEAASDAADAE